MPPLTVAYFITPHGFGHASRSAAVIEALGRRDAQINFELVTTVPEWFFSQSLSVRHRVRPVVSDVGLVQLGPVREDLPATVSALDEFWSGLDEAAENLVRGWKPRPPQLVVSDISPLGLEVARRLGVQSVLVENFTWDWIYSGYLESEPRLAEFASRSVELAASATVHVQCEPMCAPMRKSLSKLVGDSAETPTVVSPVSREPRSSRADTRRAVGLDDSDLRSLVLLTMGGTGWGSSTPEVGGDSFFVTLGGTDELSREDSILRLPNRSPIYPPDLVHASDAVIGKLGYSTVAECFRFGARLGYICRPGFPESPVLEAFVRRNLPSLEVKERDLQREDWPNKVARLLSLPAGAEQPHNGADEIADLLQALLK